MSNCENYFEMMSALIDGELSSEDTAELELHIAECPECSRVYSAFSAVSENLSEQVAVPASFTQDVMQKIAKPKRVSKPWRWQQFGALAACLALVFFAGLKSGMFDSDKQIEAMGTLSHLGEQRAAEPQAELDQVPEANFSAPESEDSIFTAQNTDAVSYVNSVITSTTNIANVDIASRDASAKKQTLENSEDIVQLLSYLEYSSPTFTPETDPDAFVLLADNSNVALWNIDGELVCELDGFSFIPVGTLEDVESIVGEIK